jgi:hypothetical protein
MPLRQRAAVTGHRQVGHDKVSGKVLLRVAEHVQAATADDV